ncbi:unnamed protein product [Soboliphyme baturini]|uniref:Transmembrane protein n=1 Tax=Soboliphyme baturini TaxID=241478 RepID=A0A183IAI7_9BILA|nr:unnamed protein product [Soboliphyme baturini]
MDQLMDRRKPKTEPWKQFQVGIVDQYTNYAFFPAKDINFKTIGSPLYPVVAQVGVPLNYGLNAGQTAEQQQKVLDRINALCFKNAKIDWSSEIGHKLKESLMLSDLAKRFGIEFELHRLWYTNLPLYSFMLTGISAYAYGEGHRLLIAAMTKRNVPVWFKVIFCGAWLFFVCSAFLKCREMLNVSAWVSGVKGALSLGEEYRNGAVEFYSKEINRNICVRRLLGYKGALRYGVDGEVLWHWYEKPRPKLTDCLQLVNSYVPEPFYTKEWTRSVLF